MHQLRQPYLLFIGDVQLKSDAKTAFGLRDWCADRVVGEHALPEASVSLGLARMNPAQAAASGAGSMVIGVAPAACCRRIGWMRSSKASMRGWTS